jgi:hypothetical protein
VSRAPLQDTESWHKLALMSEEQGFIRQAIYCWNKVCHEGGGCCDQPIIGRHVLTQLLHWISCKHRIGTKPEMVYQGAGLHSPGHLLLEQGAF